MPPEPAAKTRLTSWKEVAGFFGKTQRTVMRWEAERGLPVRRLPGAARSSIYAETAELEAWLRGPGATAAAAAAPEPTTRSPPPVVAHAQLPPRGMQEWAAIATIGVVLSAALALVVAGGFTHAPPPPPPAAKALYMKGLQDWAQRDPPALNRAVEEFTAAIRLDDHYAEAYVGLANCYNLLREFAAMPGAQAYGLARAAAARAVALNPRLAGAHAAYGFALLYGDWQFAAAIAELERAVQLEPDNPGLQHWYATALMAVGRQAAALAHIDRALELDPSAPAVRADRALILFVQGRSGEARALLTEIAAESPNFLSPHAYLAILALATGDDALFLREEPRRAALQHDAQGAAIARAAQAGYTSGGHAGMLRALIAARLAALAGGTGSASDVARAYAAAGDKPQTLAFLNRAVDRHDDGAFANVSDSEYRTLLGEQALLPLRARLALLD